MSLAAMILLLFSRAKEDHYDSDQQLQLMGGLLLGTVGLLLHSESGTPRAKFRTAARLHRKSDDDSHLQSS